MFIFYLAFLSIRQKKTLTFALPIYRIVYMLQLEDLSDIFRNRKEQYIAYAYSYIRDHTVSEDLFMEAVILLWKNRACFRPDSNIDALLLTILKNKCLDHLRHEHNRINVAGKVKDLYQRELELRINTLEHTDPDKIFSEDIQQIVEDTLRTLPDQSRQIFEMSRYQHLSNKEIAEALGMSVKTVEFHISKCLKVLRINLKDYLYILVLLHFL